MRKLHPSYDAFIKEHTPKYGQSFMEWYLEYHKLGNVDLLEELTKKTQTSLRDINSNVKFPNEEIVLPTYFTDFFMKKLQLCNNLITLKAHNDGRMSYEIGKAADIMDLYEDVIQEICTRYNIGVCNLPSGLYRNGNVYHTSEYTFHTLWSLTEEIKSGEVVIYFFVVNEADLSITVRMAKREPLTRKVLIEKDGHY
jgi:hypothetical protein